MSHAHMRACVFQGASVDRREEISCVLQVEGASVDRQVALRR